jgi:hypothetical protein
VSKKNSWVDGLMMMSWLTVLPLNSLDLEYVQLDVDQILALLNKTFTKVSLSIET